MSGELLRRAAGLMRERAEAATEGTWRAVPINGSKRADVRTEPELGWDARGSAVATAADSEFGACPTGDAEHIASWHPAVALAVADWLEAAAGEWLDWCITPENVAAVAVARAYLGADA